MGATLLKVVRREARAAGMVLEDHIALVSKSGERHEVSGDEGGHRRGVRLGSSSRNDTLSSRSVYLYEKGTGCQRSI